jgi:hypothetical protein
MFDLVEAISPSGQFGQSPPGTHPVCSSIAGPARVTILALPGRALNAFSGRRERAARCPSPGPATNGTLEKG